MIVDSTMLETVRREGRSGEGRILFVDHSFHKKTRSNSFFVDLLSEHYEIDIFWDDFWRDGNAPDFGMLDDTYSAVVFFQALMPSYLESVSCRNIIFVPMYDSCYFQTIDYWFQLRNVKVLSFSRTVFQTLSRLGLTVEFLQYFPNVERVSNNSDTGKSVFFWNRTKDITWNTLRVLLEKIDIKSVHIHMAVDPNYRFERPTRQEEERYGITYSEWYKNKEEYLGSMKDKSIFIAPRKTEGIGISFLEAMALGKVVIAANHPTMNEYIVHGKNGILFDDTNPRPLDDFDVKALSRNAIASSKNGRKAWVDSVHRIVDLVEAPMPNIVTFERKYYLMKKKVRRFKAATRILEWVVPNGFVEIYRKHFVGKKRESTLM